MEPPKRFEIALGWRPQRVLELDEPEARRPKAEPRGHGQEHGPPPDGTEGQACRHGNAMEEERDEAGDGQHRGRDDDRQPQGQGSPEDEGRPEHEAGSDEGGQDRAPRGNVPARLGPEAVHEAGIMDQLRRASPLA